MLKERFMTRREGTSHEHIFSRTFVSAVELQLTQIHACVHAYSHADGGVNFLPSTALGEWAEME